MSMIADNKSENSDDAFFGDVLKRMREIKADSVSERKAEVAIDDKMVEIDADDLSVDQFWKDFKLAEDERNEREIKEHDELKLMRKELNIQQKLEQGRKAMIRNFLLERQLLDANNALKRLQEEKARGWDKIVDNILNSANNTSGRGIINSEIHTPILNTITKKKTITTSSDAKDNHQLQGQPSHEPVDYYEYEYNYNKYIPHLATPTVNKALFESEEAYHEAVRREQQALLLLESTAAGGDLDIEQMRKLPISSSALSLASVSGYASPSASPPSRASAVDLISSDAAPLKHNNNNNNNNTASQEVDSILMSSAAAVASELAAERAKSKGLQASLAQCTARLHEVEVERERFRNAALMFAKEKETSTYYKDRAKELEMQLVEVDRQRFGLDSIEGVLAYPASDIVGKPKTWRAANKEKRAKKGVVFS